MVERFVRAARVFDQPALFKAERDLAGEVRAAPYDSVRQVARDISAPNASNETKIEKDMLAARRDCAKIGIVVPLNCPTDGTSPCG